MVTLTRRNPGGYDPDRLLDQVRQIRRQWRQLWDATWGTYKAERVPVQEAGVGAVFGIEIAPPKEKGGGGMVHVHALVWGAYIPQAELSQLWHRITGDSWVVDIRIVGLSPRKLARLRRDGHRVTPADHLRAGVLECLKYCTKPGAFGGDQVEAFLALAAIEYAYSGTRRLGALGIFYGKVSETLGDPDYAPQFAGLSCPCCSAPAYAGRIVGPGFLRVAFSKGAAWYVPNVDAQPPPGGKHGDR